MKTDDDADNVDDSDDRAEEEGDKSGDEAAERRECGQREGKVVMTDDDADNDVEDMEGLGGGGGER